VCKFNKAGLMDQYQQTVEMEWREGGREERGQAGRGKAVDDEKDY